MTNPELDPFIRRTLHVSRVHLTAEHRETIGNEEGEGESAFYIEDSDTVCMHFPSFGFGDRWEMEVVEALDADARAIGWADLAAIAKLAIDHQCHWIEFDQADETEPMPASAGLQVYP